MSLEEIGRAIAAHPHVENVNDLRVWQISTGFPRSRHTWRHYPEQNPVLRDLLPAIATPTQIVAGRGDDLVPWSNNQCLHDLLPNRDPRS
jgi:pimeloyl-ACP methyl ester carboxylesterase